MSVSECCLMSSEQFFSYIMGRTSHISMRWWRCLLCTLTNRLSWILIVLAHLNTCRSTLTYHPDYEPTSLCSYSLMLCDRQRSNKYQFDSLWCNLTRAWTNNLTHSIQAPKKITITTLRQFMLMRSKNITTKVVRSIPSSSRCTW